MNIWASATTRLPILRRPWRYLLTTRMQGWISIAWQTLRDSYDGTGSVGTPQGGVPVFFASSLIGASPHARVRINPIPFYAIVEDHEMRQRKIAGEAGRDGQKLSCDDGNNCRCNEHDKSAC